MGNRHLQLVTLFSLCMHIMPCRTAAQDPDTVVVKARAAIERGLAYFNHPSLKPDPDAVLLHTYLKDRFGLPELGYARSMLSRIRSDSTSQLYMFLRLAEPRPCEMHFLDPNGPDDVSLAGLWYDELEEPSLLMERIREIAWTWDEPYVVTHSLWAMAMAQHCFQAELDTAVERQLVGLNRAIMARSRPLWNDVAIEALAMAQYHDPSFVPPVEYVQEIIDLQNPNGSWNWVAGDATTESQHTTILGLWALLQYRPLAWPTKPRDMALSGHP
jgi:hypothetical protein